MDAATVAVYERRAEEWIVRRRQRGDGLGLRLRELAGEGPVADLGCGPGRYLAEELGPLAVGLDASAAMLALARRHGRPLVRGDLENLPFRSGSLAGLLARHSYLHLRKNAMVGALVEARRVLRPGGVLVATLIEGSYEGHRLSGDDFPGRFFALWRAQEIATVLAEAGLEARRVATVRRGRDEADLVIEARRPASPRDAREDRWG